MIKTGVIDEHGVEIVNHKRSASVINNY